MRRCGYTVRGCKAKTLLKEEGQLQEKNNNSPEIIKDILDNLAENSKQDSIHEAEFVFGKEENPSALVFDDSDEEEAPIPEQKPSILSATCSIISRAVW